MHTLRTVAEWGCISDCLRYVILICSVCRLQDMYGTLSRHAALLSFYGFGRRRGLFESYPSALYLLYYPAVARGVHTHGREDHCTRTLFVQFHALLYFEPLQALVVERMAYIQEYEKDAVQHERIPPAQPFVVEYVARNDFACGTCGLAFGLALFALSHASERFLVNIFMSVGFHVCLCTIGFAAIVRHFLSGG